MDHATAKKIVALFRQGADPYGIANRYKTSTRIVNELGTGKIPMPMGTDDMASDPELAPLVALLKKLYKVPSLDEDDVIVAKASLTLPDLHTVDDLKAATKLHQDRIANCRVRLKKNGFFCIRQAHGKRQFYVLTDIVRQTMKVSLNASA